MAFSFSRQSQSYSARSISSSGGLTLSSGQSLVGAGQTRVGSAASMYAGAGGIGTRISQAVYPSQGLGYYSETTLIGNEKGTMQNLNDRLATYLEKVRSLESANRKLELQIREYYDKRVPSVSRDFTAYFATITDLRAKIQLRFSDNQRIILQVDNARMASDDFKMKYETELNLRQLVEADVARLRGVRDSFTLSVSDLEVQIEGLKEELVFLKSNHEEEMRLLRVQQAGTVNVEVDSRDSSDLNKVLEEVREQYESLMLKNKLEQEKWFQTKMEALQKEIITYGAETKTSSSELSELKRTYQSLEISRTSTFTEIQCLQQNLEEMNGRYSIQLNQLQVTINALEAELQQLRLSIEQQQTEYNTLLDLKMRLELEIAEYRRLLEGEAYERKQYEAKKTVVVVEKVEERKPHIERRVKTIVEEVVDGRVVSSSVETEVENIQ